MDGFDTTTWQALGLVLTVLGLGVSAVVWARRGPGRGLRAVAWSLLPLAAGLTGVLRLGWEIVDAVLRWGAGLAFSPIVWVGLVVTVVAAVLFVVSGWLVRRESPGPKKQSEVAHVSRAPLAGSRREGVSRTGSAGDDMADVEDILRKHGIQ